MDSLVVSLCAHPLRSLISMLTALVSSRARVMLRRRLCLSMGYPAQSGEPRCLPGWSGCLLARGWLNSDVPPGNPVCLLGGDGNGPGDGGRDGRYCPGGTGWCVRVQVIPAELCWRWLSQGGAWPSNYRPFMGRWPRKIAST